MSKTKYLKGDCQHCSGHIEFPAESIGLSVTCPHCGQDTELRLYTPRMEPAVPRRVVLWTVIAIVILVGGLLVSIWGLKYYQNKLAAERERTEAARKATEPVPVPDDPIAQAGFQVSKIQLEKTPGSALVYAVGIVSNQTDRQRFGIRLEMDLLNAAGEKVGTAKDYQQVIEPHAQWAFKAIVVDSKAVSAKVASLKEDQK